MDKSKKLKRRADSNGEEITKICISENTVNCKSGVMMK